MLLEKYVNQSHEGFSFSRKQACEFAKQVATDFNPIHDEDAKRFCVPGDLLFAVLLHKYGLTEQLSCTFNGMVGSDGVWTRCVCDRRGLVLLISI